MTERDLGVDIDTFEKIFKCKNIRSVLPLLDKHSIFAIGGILSIAPIHSYFHYESLSEALRAVINPDTLNTHRHPDNKDTISPKIFYVNDTSIILFYLGWLCGKGEDLGALSEVDIVSFYSIRSLNAGTIDFSLIDVQVENGKVVSASI